MKTNSLPQKEEIIAAVSGGTKNVFVIYDQVLNEKSFFRSWIQKFQYTYPVEAGENLKAIENLPEHMAEIIGRLSNVPHQQTCFVAVGGGTIGDFGGFAASIYKRGVKLVHIPSTWLAALDSAHGGKTAVNVGQFKNQVGTFYPANCVFLVNEILQELGRNQSRSAMGELIKIAIISGKGMVKEIARAQGLPHEVIWDHLSAAIKAKMKIVNKDPFEQKGERQKLNLGHTLGHAIESQFKLPHGFAVAQGLYFSINWSLHSNLLSKSDYEQIKKALDRTFREQQLPGGEPIGNFLAADLKQYLMIDKKLVDESRLNFVFVRGLGKVEVAKVAISNLVQEAKRQGWAV